MKKIIMPIVVLLMIIGFTNMGCGTYNQIVTLDENVNTTWSEVENQFQRRLDLIPNLVNTVKGYATHEKDVFVQVTEARAKVGGATTREAKIDTNNQLTSALSKLLLVVERYPDLKANQNFLDLQNQLEGTENRIAVARKRYNDSIREYNTYIRRFPNNLIGKIFGYGRQDVYFKADEEAGKAPEVKF